MPTLRIEYKNSDSLIIDIEQYNQIYINHYYTFFKFLMKLKEFEEEKFDEYHNEKFKAELFLANQKKTKKDLLVIDLNNFSKIISNLTFEKNSLLRKVYLKKLYEQLDDNAIEKLNFDVENLFKINNNLEFDYKYPSFEKIIEIFFTVHFKEQNNFLKNPNLIISIIKEYLTQTSMECLLIIDSSVKALDYKKLIDDPRILVLDTSIDVNECSSNILLFNKNEIENIKLEDLLRVLKKQWPVNINEEELKILLRTYLRIVLNSEIKLFDSPSSNLIYLYILVKKNLELKIDISEFENVKITNKICIKFIQNNL